MWQRYVGIPWKMWGASFTEGVDCLGLVFLVYAEVFGIDLQCFLKRQHGFGPKELGRAFGEISPKAFDVFEKTNHPRVGDLILLYNYGKIPSHCGIVVDRNRMLHVERDQTSTIEEFSGMRWKNVIEGFYRHQDVQPLSTT